MALREPLLFLKCTFSFFMTLGPSWIPTLTPPPTPPPSPLLVANLSFYHMKSSFWSFIPLCILNDHIFGTSNQNLRWGGSTSETLMIIVWKIGQKRRDDTGVFSLENSVLPIHLLASYFVKPTKHHKSLLTVCMAS